MKPTRKYATERIEALRTFARCSNFVFYIGDIAPFSLLVLYVRESTRSQRLNLPYQNAYLKNEVEKLGFVVVEIFEEIGSGWVDGRPEFERAVLKAQSMRAVLVAACMDRFRRCWRYQTECETPPLNLFEMKRLMTEADGVRLATLIHPDAPRSVVRSEQTKWGQAGRGNYGGRPVRRFPKKEKRLAKKPQAVDMRKAGLSYGQISRALRIPRSTVRDWIKNPHTLYCPNQHNDKA
jgi:DNA invertase Pin-like site-specific DNA recombinase